MDFFFFKLNHVLSSYCVLSELTKNPVAMPYTVACVELHSKNRHSWDRMPERMQGTGHYGKVVFYSGDLCRIPVDQTRAGGDGAQLAPDILFSRQGINTLRYLPVSVQWAAFRVAILYVAFFQRKLYPFLAAFVPAFSCLLTVEQQKVWGGGYALCKTVVLHFVTKKRPTRRPD